MAEDRRTTKPVTRRGQESATRILDATLRLLEREGFAHLTTNHIARESGVKVGSLYRFYPNKEAILIAVVERWLESILQTTNDYLTREAKNSNFCELIQGLFRVNLEVEYMHSAAYQEVYQGASTVPVLIEVFNRHQQAVAGQVAACYRGVKMKNKSQVMEFCLFLHSTISSALSIVSMQKKSRQARQTAWVLKMIEGAVEAFESE